MNKPKPGDPFSMLKPSDAIDKVRLYSTRQAFASLLGVNYGKHLVYYLYRMPLAYRYKTFAIPKRGGGERQIEAPTYGLAHVQRRLAAILATMYSPRQGVHGFTRDKGIHTNAEPHTKAKFVLNLDLENFFHSINFGRVRGLLQAAPYQLNGDIAELIATIVCHNGRLPQGAPTSPILSNMVAAKMDADLKAVAKAHGCFYTRYADDITLSRTRGPFPDELASWQFDEGKRRTILGPQLTAAVVQNGFSVNAGKTRLLTRSDRQIVTGLVVNRKVNVKRRYVRNLRGAIHAWRKFGLEKAQNQFDFSYAGGIRLKRLDLVLRGRIQFVGSVRGFSDSLYKNLRDQFNELAENKIPTGYDPKMRRLQRATWVIENKTDIEQGTAFFLEGYGLVTCAHCVGAQPFIYHPSNPSKEYPVSILRKDDHLDLAILEVQGLLDEDYEKLLPQAFQTKLEVRSEVTLIGYPNHAPGKRLSLKDGHVQSSSVAFGMQRINITMPVIAGNSGGPMVNRHGRVLGIAVTGADDLSKAQTTEDHGVIPISYIAQL